MSGTGVRSAVVCVPLCDSCNYEPQGAASTLRHYCTTPRFEGWADLYPVTQTRLKKVFFKQIHFNAGN